MNLRERNQLIDSLIEGDISEADFIRLEAEFTVDPATRKDYYDRVALSALLGIEATSTTVNHARSRYLPTLNWRYFSILAATIVILLAVASMWKKTSTQDIVTNKPEAEEQKASGFAIVSGQSEAIWKNITPLADGALVPTGMLHLSSGAAQIELFSGVTVVIEGDTEFQIHSPMEMTVARGKVCARVPEPAHGFRIHTAEGEVVDLGTEFALNVSLNQSEVHVLEGEVEWHPKSDVMRRMEKGQALSWSAEGKGLDVVADATGFVSTADIDQRLIATRKERHEAWLVYREKFQRDPRLIAYYSMDTAQNGSRRLRNLAQSSITKVGEGAIVAASPVADRWGVINGALDFSPTGSRVRVTVPGEYHALTLVTWVKINSLDRLYNSLFLTDGHDLGEPHWQIMNDGRLFFSVKKFENRKGHPDKYNFLSPVIWTPSLSGQWIMLATVYDPVKKMTTHFLNGKPVSSEAIPDEYLVDRINIGSASICNWSEPIYRTDPEFTVRNLNGSMDELLLFNAALPNSEIAQIYENGRP